MADDIKFNKSMVEVQGIIGEWAEHTFSNPPHTSTGIALHFVREAIEMAMAIGVSEADILLSVAKELIEDENKAKSYGEEMADCQILLFTLADYMDLNLEDETYKKHHINLERQWRKPDFQGIREHERPEEPEEAFSPHQMPIPPSTIYELDIKEPLSMEDLSEKGRNRYLAYANGGPGMSSVMSVGDWLAFQPDRSALMATHFERERQDRVAEIRAEVDRVALREGSQANGRQSERA